MKTLIFKGFPIGWLINVIAVMEKCKFQLNISEIMSQKPHGPLLVTVDFC